MTDKLQAAMRIIGQYLDSIEREVFKKGSNMKLTFIARDPGNPEADMLVSEDDLAEIIALVHRSVTRKGVK